MTIWPASACAWTALEMVNDVYLLAGDASGMVALLDLVCSVLSVSRVLFRMPCPVSYVVCPRRRCPPP